MWLQCRMTRSQWPLTPGSIGVQSATRGQGTARGAHHPSPGPTATPLLAQTDLGLKALESDVGKQREPSRKAPWTLHSNRTPKHIREGVEKKIPVGEQREPNQVGCSPPTLQLNQ